MLSIENVGETIKLWSFYCDISIFVILYTINLLHTYRLGNTHMTTTEKILHKIIISDNFLLLAI